MEITDYPTEKPAIDTHRLTPNPPMLTFLPEQGLGPVGQNKPAAPAVGFYDVITLLGFWVEGAGIVQGLALCYIHKTTEKGFLDTTYRQQSTGC